MRFEDQGENSANRRATGNAEDVGIGERIAQQSLETRAGNGKRSAHEDGQKNPWQADIENDEAIFAGELAGLAKGNANQVVTEAVEGNGDSAHFESDDDNDEQDGGEDGAVQEQTAEG
jgi:hypothetical protein